MDAIAPSRTAKACLPFLNDPDDQIAGEACIDLGQANEKRYSGALVRVLEGNRAALWMPAAVGLSLLESKRPTRRLLQLVLNDSLPETQHYAATYALGFTSAALTDPRYRNAIVNAFIRLLDNGQIPTHVRGVAAEGLGNLMGGCFGDAGTIPQERHAAALSLTSVLRDPEPEVRFWAAFALGNLGNEPATLPALRAIAGKDEGRFGNWWTVGEEASDAIDRIEGREPPERMFRYD